MLDNNPTRAASIFLDRACS